MITKVVHKRCPKCGGNIFIDGDHYGWYEKCLQCAYTGDIQNVPEAREELSHSSKRLAP